MKGETAVELMEAEGAHHIDDAHERQGSLWTATAHIVTAIIGSGVLALAWSVAQLGWIAGPVALLGFAGVTYCTATLLANCYRSSDACASRNPTYMDAVRSYLGPREVVMCGVAQYVNLWGTLVGYTITATTSMVAIKKSDCYHRDGPNAACEASGTLLMAVFGAVQLVLSQFPSLEKVTWLSVVAAAMSFAYSFVGLGLCIAKWASHGDFRGAIAGSAAPSPTKKAWNSLLALGNIAFAYTFAEICIEIQDTLKPHPPEKVVMKRAAMYGIGVTTIFYLSLGCAGYAAFGNDAPGNILTGFGFYEPFWLVDIGNMCIILHLIGAYQVYAQPIFAAVEQRISSQWPENKFIDTVYTIQVPFTKHGYLSFSLSKLVLRSILVLLTTLVAMMLPFFNAVLGLLGAFSFWPLTVYFPVSMHVAQKKIERGTAKWMALQTLIVLCLLVSVAVGIGSVTDIVDSLKMSTPFKL
ncbi:amino acid permease 6-like [Canna indica]|uniref:Amino acid permease 6-like n=1 Tax=Canna indica TaxID=4628 RepID=A0AAQ3JR00_9LILI|nr:amino acid permease 6-like [Canna indica]